MADRHFPMRLKTNSSPFVFAGLGPELKVFRLEADGVLDQVQSLQMPAMIQYCCFSADRSRMYLALSNLQRAAKGVRLAHYVCLYRLTNDGRLESEGQIVSLENRPLHITLDREERHLLLAYNDPPDVTVHRLAADGAIGPRMAQDALPLGTTVHQVELSPDGTTAFVPACAHDPAGEAEGYISLFAYRDGKLTFSRKLAGLSERRVEWLGKRNGAHGFSPRHVAFHPTRELMYVCVEAQGEVWTYALEDGRPASKPIAIVSTYQGATAGPSLQMAGGIRLHPDGKTLYITNRATETEEIDGTSVFIGGLNDVVVFSIDPGTGIPIYQARHDTAGIFPRTFGLDTQSGFLVVGNQKWLSMRRDGALAQVWPGLAVFRIDADGRLTARNRIEFADTDEQCFWMDVIRLRHATA